MNFIPRIRPVLLSLILAVSFLGPAPGQTEVVSGPYHDGAESTSAAPIATPHVQAQFLNLPMRFEANQGQTNPQVNFISRGSGYTLFLTPNEAVMVLKSASSSPSPQGEEGWGEGRHDAPQAARSVSSVLRMKLVGANPSAKVEGLEELPGKSNYFIGDPSQWRTDVPSYKKVEYRDIYPGIHLIYYGNQRQLEYDFVVAPGIDPEIITLSFKGCEKVGISEGGDLVIGIAGGGEISFHKPHIYQEVEGIKRPIAGNYRLQPSDFKPSANAPASLIQRVTFLFKNILGRLVPSPKPGMSALMNQTVGFQIAAYDRNLPLVIDPTLSYSTYLGGSSGYDYGRSIAVDSSNNAYVTGYTGSTDFPTTSGAYQTSNHGGGNGYDVFVTKLASNGGSLVYSTYLGGSSDDYGYSVAVNSSGNAYVTGYTASNNFPTTSGAYQTTYGGGTYDAFVTKLATDGKSLVYSTYLGGSSSDRGYSIAVDSSGNAYVTGYTTSTNFPTTSGAYQTSNASVYARAFVTKLATDGKSLVYSTYLGGSNGDLGNSIAVDSTGYAYVTGETCSTDFPTTSGAYQTSYKGSNGSNAFVTKMKTDGSGLVYSTFLGGTGSYWGDWGNSIAIDSAGYAYVTGEAVSADFPTTSGAYQTANSAGMWTAFVTKLKTDGSGLVYSTFLGGNTADTAWSVAVDSNGYACVVGATGSSNFPTTSGAYQTSNAGGPYDVFVTKLASNGKSLYYSTYLGGSGNDNGFSVALDSSGNAYVTGRTASSNFPTTSGAYQTSNNSGSGGSTVFVFKLSGLPTAVELISLSSTEYEGGVLLQWKTGYEADNLGFNVYREEKGQFVRLNPEMIAGSALRAGKGTITAGYSYSWVDQAAISKQRSAVSTPSSTLPPRGGGRGWGGVQYWLEDIDLKGKRTRHGPVSPVFSPEPLPKKAQALLLSQLAREKRRQDPDLSRMETLQARLHKNQSSSTPSPSLSPPKSPQPPFEKGGQGGIWGGTGLGEARKASPPAKRLGNIEVLGLDDGKGTFQGSLSGMRLSDKPRLPALEIQQVLAGTSAIKLFIQKEGWYRITQPELLASGLDPKVNPRYLQLFADGKEQPILLTGTGNQLGPQDALEFYGQGLDTQFTDTRVYWLVASRTGKRVQRMASGLGSQGASSSFPFTVEKKERIFYVAALKNGGGEKFFGAVVSSEPLDQTLSVVHMDPSPPGEAVLEVALQGLADGPHQVQVLLNGVDMGSVVFSGQDRGVMQVAVFQATGLKEGDNEVRLIAQGGETDISLVDSIRLTYWHTFTADGDLLRCSAVGGKGYTIDGFTGSRVRVMDITDPEGTYEIMGTVQAQGSGYSIQFQVPNPGQRTLLAFADGRVGSPGAMEANRPSAWHGADNGADLVIITTESFLESFRPLKALREGQGLKVGLVDIEDVYDEFSFGAKNPQAIKDFLYRARTSWQKPPRFVLLGGEATFDPRNYEGYGNFDFVPTKLVETDLLETASDDWFVDFDGDGLPEMAVGRVPVRMVGEADLVVGKVLGYEGLANRMTEVMFVADMSGGDFDFEGASGGVETLLPGDVGVSRIYRGQFGDDVTVRNAILGGINGGKLWVNYMGHGSMQLWRGGIFDVQGAEGLINGMKLPFVVGMTCLNGFFHDPAPTNESMAVALLKAAQGGAVAVWASSGLTEPEGQVLMNEELVRLLFSGGALTLGEATMRAKAATSNQNVRRTWILFGDPSARLKY